MRLIRLNEFFCDNLWRRHANYSSGTNYPEIEYRDRDKLPYGSQKFMEENLPEEFDEILKYADNRMLQGKFRYGPIQRQNLDNYDVAQECINRMQRYINDGRVNLEYIVDTLNMCRIEYYKGRKAGKKMIPIDDGIHAIEKTK